MRKKFTSSLLAVLVVPMIGGAAGATNAGGGAARAEATASSGGTVYTVTNESTKNRVFAYRRAADGKLSLLAKYDTGGQGTGTYENSDTMVVLGSAEAQSSPIDLGGGDDLLYVANAGSDDVSVFRVADDGRLTLVDREPTGSERPTSLTVNRGLLYAMNSAGEGLPGAGFCLGGQPTISGFRVAGSGDLTPIAGSTRRLSASADSGCTQIQFNPEGNVLLVSQFAADRIDAFTVGADGIAQGPVVNQPAGSGPFGLEFDADGRLLTTGNFQARVGRGGVASYDVAADGRLTPIGDFVANGETDTCWIVRTPEGTFAYASSFGPAPSVTATDDERRGTIQSYRLGDDGRLELLDAQAAQVGVGAADLAMAAGGRYLYNLNTEEGTIRGWEVRDDGSLKLVTVVGGIPTDAPGPLSAGLASRDR